MTPGTLVRTRGEIVVLWNQSPSHETVSDWGARGAIGRFYDDQVAFVIATKNRWAFVCGQNSMGWCAQVSLMAAYVK